MKHSNCGEFDLIEIRTAKNLYTVLKALQYLIFFLLHCECVWSLKWCNFLRSRRGKIVGVRCGSKTSIVKHVLITAVNGQRCLNKNVAVQL